MTQGLILALALPSSLIVSVAADSNESCSPKIALNGVRTSRAFVWIVDSSVSIALVASGLVLR